MIRGDLARGGKSRGEMAAKIVNKGFPFYTDLAHFLEVNQVFWDV